MRYSVSERLSYVTVTVVVAGRRTASAVASLEAVAAAASRVIMIAEPECVAVVETLWEQVWEVLSLIQMVVAPTA
jgi:hypothetical protein